MSKKNGWKNKYVYSAKAASFSLSYLALCLNKIPFLCTAAGVWLTANIIKLCGLPFCEVESKAYRAEFFSGNLQLPSAYKRSLLWNFSISLLHSSCPHRKPTGSSGSGSNTADRVIRAQQGDPSKLQRIPRFCLGEKDSCLYKPQVEVI